MNTHDIELPDLPTPDFPGVVIKGMKAIPRYLFTGNQMAEYGHQCATAAIEADRRRTAELLKNPVHVHSNMCRGIIAPITFDQLAHVLGDEATEAWLADRKRRGEPVAWIQRSYLNLIRESNVALHNVVVRGSILDGDGDVVPLFTAPQPAEPVKVPPATAYCQHPHCQTTGGCQGPCSKKQAEPVKVPSDADAKHVQDFIDCDGMGSMIVEGPQYSAVVRALLDRYSSIHDAQRWRKARALPRSWWRDAFNRISTPEELDALIDAHGEKRLP